jgi:CMP-N,N'-diacetyllegionaminic acid synthase
VSARGGSPNQFAAFGRSSGVIHGLSVLAVVPARGGSKEVPLKNLREVGGRSLIGRVGDVIANVPEIDRAVVSTDNAGIAAAAKAAGIAAPFMRPENLSGDLVSDIDVLSHAHMAAEAAYKQRYDIAVMLQPTSPLRTPGQVSATIRMLVEEGWDSVWTVSPTDSKAHPLKQLVVAGGALGYYEPAGGAGIVARQQLHPVYHRNGIAYAMTRACLTEQSTIMGERTGALIITGEHVSIDTEWDIALVEFILTQRERSDIYVGGHKKPKWRILSAGSLRSTKNPKSG